AMTIRSEHWAFGPHAHVGKQRSRAGTAVIDKRYRTPGDILAVFGIGDIKHGGLGRAVLRLDHISRSGSRIADLLAADPGAVMRDDILLLRRLPAWLRWPGLRLNGFRLRLRLHRHTGALAVALLRRLLGFRHRHLRRRRLWLRPRTRRLRVPLRQCYTRGHEHYHQSKHKALHLHHLSLLEFLLVFASQRFPSCTFVSSVVTFGILHGQAKKNSTGTFKYSQLSPSKGNSHRITS